MLVPPTLIRLWERLPLAFSRAWKLKRNGRCRASPARLGEALTSLRSRPMDRNGDGFLQFLYPLGGPFLQRASAAGRFLCLRLGHSHMPVSMMNLDGYVLRFNMSSRSAKGL
jgi:hypothetical protein